MSKFTDLRRPASPNSFLVCDSVHCPATTADMTPPVFAHPVRDVIAAWRRMLMNEMRLSPVSADDSLMEYEYVQRSRLFGFEDEIVVRFIADETDTQTRLLVFSRSKTGYWDFGVNAARVKRLLSGLDAELARRPQSVDA